MKKDRVSKMYEKLTYKERAKLTLSYMAKNNELEIERIESSVPWQHYECINFHYLSWKEGFINMISMWGVAHWQLRTKHAETSSLLSNSRRANESDKVEEASITLLRVEARLIILDQILKKICDKHQFDTAVVSSMIGNEIFVPTCPITLSDQQYFDEMYLVFSQSFPPLQSDLNKNLSNNLEF